MESYKAEAVKVVAHYTQACRLRAMPEKICTLAYKVVREEQLRLLEELYPLLKIEECLGSRLIRKEPNSKDCLQLILQLGEDIDYISDRILYLRWVRNPEYHKLVANRLSAINKFEHLKELLYGT